MLPPSASADDVSRASGLSAEIQQAINSLPEDFRVAVVLCDVADQSYEEISMTLGVPVGTVRSRIHRGRRLLRTALVESGVME